MLIRPTTTSDLPFLDPLFAECRAYMRQEGNHSQWDENYPTAQVVADDIKQGTGYVCVDEHTGEVLATFALSDYEPEYDRLRDGAWHSSQPYVVVHRLAAKAGKGVGNFIFTYLIERYPHIRVDTHEHNQTMYHILEKYGFRHCGIVTYEGYGDRHCFDFIKA